MSPPDGFRSRVGRQVVMKRDIDPNAMRSGLAEGARELGAAVQDAARDAAEADRAIAASEHRIAMEEQARARAHAIAVNSGTLAETEARLREKLAAVRTAKDALPGAPGHADKAGTLITDELRGFIDQLPDDDEVRDRFAPMVTRLGAELRSGEQMWATAEKGRYEGAQAEKWAAATRNGIIGTPTPEKLQQALDGIDAIYDAIDLPATAREIVKTKAKADMGRALLDGRLAQGDAAGVKALLASGQFDAWLTEDGEKARYLARADNEEAQAAAQARQIAVEQAAQARDALNALKLRIDAGGVPAADEFRAVRALAQAAGLPVDDMTRIGILEQEADTIRRYEGQPLATQRRNQDALRARIASGQASDAERIAGKVLGGMIDRAESAQAEALRTLAGQGVPGKLAALARIDADSGGDAETRFNVADKLNAGWGVLAGLAPDVQQAALEGEEVRKGRPEDFGRKAEVDRDFRGAVGAALPAGYDAIRQQAWNVYAAQRNARGLTGYDADEFRTVVRRVTGARPGPDGVLVGGVATLSSGHAVQLPDTQTPQEFERALARTPFNGAIGAGGVPAAKADILRHFRPEYAGDDAAGNPIYRFVDAAGHPLGRSGGGVYQIRLMRPQ